MKKFVCYYRVSSQKQGISGLGLEAQQEAVYQYLKADNPNLNPQETDIKKSLGIIAEYTEVQSGKRNNRVMLNEALRLCKAEKAILIIKSLDRLSRSVHFISGLLESSVEFVVVENPTANKLLLHILSAVAESEREAISNRTKAALQAAKARGIKLGTSSAILAINNKNKAQTFAISMRDKINELRQSGYNTIEKITDRLNELKIPNFRNVGEWHISTTYKLLKRIEGLPATAN